MENKEPLRAKRWHWIHDFFKGFGWIDSENSSRCISCRQLNFHLPDVHLKDPTDEELDAVYERLEPLLVAWAGEHPPLPYKIPDKIYVPRFKGDPQLPDLRAVLSDNSLKQPDDGPAAISIPFATLPTGALSGAVFRVLLGPGQISSEMSLDERAARDRQLAAKKQFMQEYYVQHCCCPQCGNSDICSTTGPWFDPDRDTNDAWCACGWKGIKHDCIPEKHDATSGKS